MTAHISSLRCDERVFERTDANKLGFARLLRRFLPLLARYSFQ
jgi:hypothetical protein